MEQKPKFLRVPTFSTSHFQQQSWDTRPKPLPPSPDTKMKDGKETVNFWLPFVSVHSPWTHPAEFKPTGSRLFSALPEPNCEIIAPDCGQLHPIALRFLKMGGIAGRLSPLEPGEPFPNLKRRNNENARGNTGKHG